MDRRADADADVGEHLFVSGRQPAEVASLGPGGKVDAGSVGRVAAGEPASLVMAWWCAGGSVDAVVVASVREGGDLVEECWLCRPRTRRMRSCSAAAETGHACVLCRRWAARCLRGSP